MLNKIKKYIFPASIIILGSFLEIWYYQWRFTQDGIDAWLSITIGIALTLLLSLAVYMRKLKTIWFLIIPLSIYSVICTSAGQSFSLGIVINEDMIEAAREEYTQQEIDDIQKRIEWIDQELIRLREVKNETIKSLADRYEWKNTLRITEERERELTEERLLLSKQLSELRSKAKTTKNIKQRSTNIYEFYSDMIDIPPEWLQFILHTILSVFIALMAPIGIIIITDMFVSKPHKKKKYKKQDKNTMAKIEGAAEYWVNLNWMGLRNKKSRSILPENVFHKFVSNRGEIFSKNNYKIILQAAMKLGIIDKNGEIKTESEREAIRKIINLLLTKN